MISPQEKAEELVDKYKPFVYCYMGSGMLSNDYDENVVFRNAKECALIAVDEILKALKYPPKANENRHIIHVETIIYWQEVREELLKK